MFAVLRRRSDGSGAAQLTHLGGINGDVAFSPDGSRITFSRSEGEDKPFEIYSPTPMAALYDA